MKDKNNQKVSLDAILREEIGASVLKRLRKDGFMPAVVYGQGKPTQSIRIQKGAVLKYLHEHGRENVIIDLRVMKDSKVLRARPVLIKDIQHHPLTGEPIHMDFYEVSLTEVIQIQVPIAATGTPVGVKQEGGMLEHHLWKLNIECLPSAIPKEITFDVTNLKMGEIVHIKDLSIPEGIKVLHEPDAIVFSVILPKKEVSVAEEAVEGGTTEPEVIKEKKKEEEASVEGGKKEEKKPEKKEEKKEKG